MKKNKLSTGPALSANNGVFSSDQRDDLIETLNNVDAFNTRSIFDYLKDNSNSLSQEQFDKLITSIATITAPSHTHIIQFTLEEIDSLSEDNIQTLLEGLKRTESGKMHIIIFVLSECTLLSLTDKKDLLNIVLKNGAINDFHLRALQKLILSHVDGISPRMLQNAIDEIAEDTTEYDSNTIINTCIKSQSLPQSQHDQLLEAWINTLGV